MVQLTSKWIDEWVNMLLGSPWDTFKHINKHRTRAYVTALLLEQWRNKLH